jgi:hypothetical protein
MASTTSGYLLIADITGYTQYLSESELEHAQGVLSSLLEVLLGETKAPLVLSRLAGDAVISYALGDAFPNGQTFLELVENTYVAFRRAVDRMVLNNTCKCNACANVSALDLKFFVHHGTFARQKLSAHEELVGNDVNLLFRLLKNRVTEVTGLRAYALYTDAAIQKLGLEGLTESMRAHSEAYEHVGEVKVWVQDMAPTWAARKQAAKLPLQNTIGRWTTDIALDAATVWSYLTEPSFLMKLLGTARLGYSDRKSGRVDLGTVIACYHGEHATVLTVVEWTPFERVLHDSVMHLPVSTANILCEFSLEPFDGGTRLGQAFGPPRGPWLGRNLARGFMAMISGRMQKDLDGFKTLIEADHASRGERPEPLEMPTPEARAQAARESLQSAS